MEKVNHKNRKQKQNLNDLKSKRFDIDNLGFVKSDVFMKRLGLASELNDNTDSTLSLNHSINHEDNGSSMSIPYANIAGF